MSNHYGDMLKIFGVLNFFIVASTTITCHSCYQKDANVSNRKWSKYLENIAIQAMRQAEKNSTHFCYNNVDFGEPEVCADGDVCFEMHFVLDFGKQKTTFYIWQN